MATALELITDALMDIGVQGLEQPVTAADSQLALRHLNRMLAKWANQPAAMYNNYLDTLALTPGVQSYSTSLLSQGNPQMWNDVNVTIGGVTYPCDFVTAAQWDQLAFKATSGLPRWCWVDVSWPNSTIYFYPLPSAAYTANFRLQLNVNGTMTLATTVSLPPGYETAIVANLAVRLAVPYTRPVSAELAAEARDSLAWLKRTNHKPEIMDTTQLPTGHRRWVDINRGY